MKFAVVGLVFGSIGIVCDTIALITRPTLFMGLMMVCAVVSVIFCSMMISNSKKYERNLTALRASWGRDISIPVDQPTPKPERRSGYLVAVNSALQKVREKPPMTRYQIAKAAVRRKKA